MSINSIISIFKKNTITIIFFIFIINLLILLIANYNKYNNLQKMLIISNNIFHDENNVNTVIQSNVNYKFYNYDTAYGFFELINIIERTMKENNLTHIDSLGIMYKTRNYNTLQIFKNQSPIITEKTNDNNLTFEDYELLDSLLLFLNYVKDIYGVKNVDIIASNVSETTSNKLLTYISTIMPGINLNTSTDLIAINNDWYLQRGDRYLLDQAGYFNENIKNVNVKLISEELLDSEKNKQFKLKKIEIKK